MRIFATERNSEVLSHIQKQRSHPYFFPDAQLPENIHLVENAVLHSLLPQIDIIISVIPCQFTATSLAELAPNLKRGVIILNLSKGIDNQSLQTVSEKLDESLGESLPYSYAYLAGGMIAQEVVQGNKLGADIVTEHREA